MERNKIWRANALLMLTAAIWGMGFVAQRAGATGLGPFSYNALRFALGSLALLAALPLIRRVQPAHPSTRRAALVAGLVAGLVLFTASSLQTVGLKYTLPGKAGFITGLYVVLVPVMGLFLRHKTGLVVWMGVALAVVGLYFLTASSGVTIQAGDGLILLGAFFWALHVLVIDYFSTRVDALAIALGQFSLTALLSLLTGLIIEPVSLQAVWQNSPAILYGGLLSVGVAFTLQIVGQKDTHPGHAAIILVSEAMFAVLGGWLLMGERLAAREMIGCALMLAGMVLAVAAPFMRKAPVVARGEDLAAGDSQTVKP